MWSRETGCSQPRGRRGHQGSAHLSPLPGPKKTENPLSPPRERQKILPNPTEVRLQQAGATSSSVHPPSGPPRPESRGPHLDGARTETGQASATSGLASLGLRGALTVPVATPTDTPTDTPIPSLRSGPAPSPRRRRRCPQPRVPHLPSAIARKPEAGVRTPRAVAGAPGSVPYPHRHGVGSL